jgi:hypothetical protein
LSLNISAKSSPASPRLSRHMQIMHLTLPDKRAKHNILSALCSPLHRYSLLCDMLRVCLHQLFLVKRICQLRIKPEPWPV